MAWVQQLLSLGHLRMRSVPAPAVLPLSLYLMTWRFAGVCDKSLIVPARGGVLGAPATALLGVRVLVRRLGLVLCYSSSGIEPRPAPYEYWNSGHGRRRHSYRSGRRDGAGVGGSDEKQQWNQLLQLPLLGALCGLVAVLPSGCCGLVASLPSGWCLMPANVCIRTSSDALCRSSSSVPPPRASPTPRGLPSGRGSAGSPRCATSSACAAAWGGLGSKITSSTAAWA